jgi:hypothetical protein
MLAQQAKANAFGLFAALAEFTGSVAQAGVDDDRIANGDLCHAAANTLNNSCSIGAHDPGRHDVHTGQTGQRKKVEMI